MNVTTTCRDLKELTDNARAACEIFLSHCEARGLKVLITETYRSQERQNYLYEQGRSRSGEIVTWTKNSRHTSRRAWDICQNIKNKEYSDDSFFKKCGQVANELGIIWGGNWDTPDTPHFEISENWQLKMKEDEQMSTEEKNQLNNLTTEVYELKKTIEEIKNSSNKMIYNYIDSNMPSWARDTVQNLVTKGYLKGNENGELSLSEDMLRILVLLDRANVF